MNLSKNKCQANTAFVCIPSSSGTSSVSLASINENNSTYRTCYFGNSAKSHELLSSNIINNQCTDSNNGMIFTYNPLDIKHCCILDNTASKWFEGNGATITITNCTIKEEDITKTSGSVTTNDWKPSSSFGIVQLSMRTWKYDIHNN